MNLIKYYLESWRRFRDLKGRTTRPAFWWPFFIHPIVFLILGGIFATIFGIESDEMGRKGTWLLISLVPFGILVLLYWLVRPSTSETSE